MFTFKANKTGMKTGSYCLRCRIAYYYKDSDRNPFSTVRAKQSAINDTVFDFFLRTEEVVERDRELHFSSS